MKTEISDTLSYVANGMIKEPVTYLNVGAMMISVTDVETYLKITLYLVSIVASVLVSRKYLLEIKKLKDSKNEDK